MPEDEDQKDEPKLEFDSAGQAIAYISLDQARVLALQHARDNREFYGRRYRRRELVWEELGAEESEDYYRIRLSYRPAQRFRGEPGVEQFTIDKVGPIEFRQIVSHPVELRRRGLLYAVATLGILIIAGGATGGLFAAGILPPASQRSLQNTPTETPIPSTTLSADALIPAETATPTSIPTIGPSVAMASTVPDARKTDTQPPTATAVLPPTAMFTQI